MFCILKKKLKYKIYFVFKNKSIDDNLVITLKIKIESNLKGLLRNNKANL